MAKETTNVEKELEWLEKRASEIKTYVDNNPYHRIEDRVTQNGKSIKVMATIEQQQKSIRNALKDYAKLVESIDKLREIEKAKIEARGNQDLNSRMEKLVNG